MSSSVYNNDFLTECNDCENLYDMFFNHRGCPKCAAKEDRNV